LLLSGLLRLLPSLMSSIERDVLVDHVERLWAHVGLQRRLNDLTNGGLVCLVPALEPTDCGAQHSISLLVLTLLHQLPDDLLLFVEPSLDWVRVRGFIIQAIVVGRLLPTFRWWRLPEFDSSSSSQESEGLLRLCL
jgi:hypothetical protein